MQELSHWSECSGEGHARDHTHKFPKFCAATVWEPEPQTIHITDNPTKNQSSRSSWPTTAFVQDAPGKELFTILDMLDVAFGMMEAISVEEKGPATYVVSAVVEHLRAWCNPCTGRVNTICRAEDGHRNTLEPSAR